MSLEDELLELNAVYQSVQEKNEALRLENKDLRTLLDDYEQWIEDTLSGRTGFMHSYPEFRGQWQERRDGLKARYDALMKGGKP